MAMGQQTVYTKPRRLISTSFTCVLQKLLIFIFTSFVSRKHTDGRSHQTPVLFNIGSLEEEKKEGLNPNPVFKSEKAQDT